MNHDEADKETQTWLAILSGETVAEADPSMVFEAEALRAVLQCRLHPPQLNLKILDHVIVQLQKEGLLQQKEGWIKQWQRVIIQQVIKFLPTTSPWLWQWRVGLSFAFALFIAVIIFPPFSKPVPTARGGSPYCKLFDANPQARAAQLQTELAKIGVNKTTLRTRGPTRRLEVEMTDLSSSSVAELEDLLNRQNCQGGWTAGSTLRAIIVMQGNN